MSAFPTTGELSIQTIRDAFGLTGTVSMSTFYGRTLYNADGSRITVPSSGTLDINYFRGKYYTAPPIPEVTVSYTTVGTVSITIPSGKARTPNRYVVTLYSGGGGGGGGGGAGVYSGSNNTSGGGGGGGGGGGKAIYYYPYTPGLDISGTVGGGGTGGDGGAGSRWDDNQGDGKRGDDGKTTSITIGGGTPVTLAGGAGGGGGEAGHDWIDYPAPGTGGTKGPGGTVDPRFYDNKRQETVDAGYGHSGGWGSAENGTNNGGGGGGAGGAAIDGYGAGGAGNWGGATGYRWAQDGSKGYDGSPGAIIVTWYYES